MSGLTTKIFSLRNGVATSLANWLHSSAHLIQGRRALMSEESAVSMKSEVKKKFQ